MAKPVIGIIGNSHLINDEYPVQAVGLSNIEAVADLTGAIPLVVPAIPKVGAIADLIEACDGFVFTGGRPNIHPSHYGHEPTEKHGAFDPDRDAVTLPLIRECIARGVPVFGICRGFQEFNVAFGGTLHPEIRRQYGIGWTPERERGMERLAGLSRRVLPWLPSPLRHAPQARAADRRVTRAGARQPAIMR